MPRKLKVFWANYDGKRKVLAAVTSKQKFKEITGITGNPADWVAETGNEYDIETAMSAPGKVFVANFEDRGNDDTDWHLREDCEDHEKDEDDE